MAFDERVFLPSSAALGGVPSALASPLGDIPCGSSGNVSAFPSEQGVRSRPLWGRCVSPAPAAGAGESRDLQAEASQETHGALLGHRGTQPALPASPGVGPPGKLAACCASLITPLVNAGIETASSSLMRNPGRK